jgi:hypothetical protein
VAEAIHHVDNERNRDIGERSGEYLLDGVMKLAALLALAVALSAADKPVPKPDREEQVVATREVRVFGLPFFKIITTRKGSAAGDPKRGPKMIPVPRDPISERIEAIKK